MRITLISILFFSFCISLHAQDTMQHMVAGRKNAASQITKPYVILISSDGFRYDYAEKYNAQHLLKLRSSGVKAKSMIPSFPSVTYPNHYTVATGLYPSHHGLVYNQFYDRSRQSSYNISDRKTVEDGTWYGGTPIWVLAEQQAMLTASYFFVGDEAAIQQTYATYRYHFNDTANVDFRINKVVEWLKLPEDMRPHLICFYISNVDHDGHMFGPDAPQTEAAVQFVDKAIGSMTEKINALGLPVNYIFLSDHGMAAVDTITRINIETLIDTARFILRGGNTSLHLYAKDIADIQPTYELLKKQEQFFTAFLREEIPAKWHFTKTDDRFNRIGDIFIVPQYPKVLSNYTNRINPGAHGFDPAIKKMHATFYAWGPQIKTGKTIRSFENIHVYPLVCRLLGLTYTEPIDGDPKVLKKIIRKN
ncbi:MAG: alkaline phosphatase family protein [Chitinophagaceae bacterium]|nr:alkaline phosphatase family protein [Chitinophagaceae bacterium]